MQIKELLEAVGELPATQTSAPAVDTTSQEAEPTPKDVADIQALLGTIDVTKEHPQTLLNKLTSWIKQYPIIDKVTDIIPQTRLVKSIAQALDALETGNAGQALNSLAVALGGPVAKAAQALNVGTALAQGDVRTAAMAVGGTAAKLAKGASAVSNLAQGNTAQAVGDVAGKTAQRAVQYAQTALAPRPAAQVANTQTAQEPDELDRIKQLANV